MSRSISNGPDFDKQLEVLVSREQKLATRQSVFYLIKTNQFVIEINTKHKRGVRVLLIAINK
jgi:hypothetical protein